MDYFKLFEALYLAKIKYLVCGGLAVNIYGIPRMTADVDLLIADPSKARKVLGWKTKVSFSQLVQMMVDADMERLKAAKK